VYKVLDRKNAPHFPKNTLTLWYDVDFDGDNSEWRTCAADVLQRLESQYLLTPVCVPAFKPHEDFVELKYLLGCDLITLSCDFTLYSIFIETPSEHMASSLAEYLAKQVGWESG
jgi:hypothetical protein